MCVSLYACVVKCVFFCTVNSQYMYGYFGRYACTVKAIICSRIEWTDHDHTMCSMVWMRKEEEAKEAKEEHTRQSTANETTIQRKKNRKEEAMIEEKRKKEEEAKEAKILEWVRRIKLSLTDGSAIIGTFDEMIQPQVESRKYLDFIRHSIHSLKKHRKNLGSKIDEIVNFIAIDGASNNHVDTTIVIKTGQAAYVLWKNRYDSWVQACEKIKEVQTAATTVQAAAKSTESAVSAAGREQGQKTAHGRKEGRGTSAATRGGRRGPSSPPLLSPGIVQPGSGVSGSSKPSAHVASPTDPASKIYIGNLASETTNDRELGEIFSRHGKLGI